jgi:hypothetical protein
MTRQETDHAYAIAKTDGKPAEARINGILRGGYLHDGIFFAHAGPARGVVYAAQAEVTELRVHALARGEG